MKILRYKNRKLYMEGKYLGLNDIKQYVTEGRDFSVIDYPTKNDITIDILKRVVGYVNVDRERLSRFIKENA